MTSNSMPQLNCKAHLNVFVEFADKFLAIRRTIRDRATS